MQDRTIYEDSVFARVLKDSGQMEPREYETYLSLFSNMSNFMYGRKSGQLFGILNAVLYCRKKPNLIVHLDVSPEESLRRIKMRSRNCEVGIKLEYLRDLHKAYEEFLQDIARIIPVIRVNYEQFHTTDEMAEMIVR